MTFHERMLEKNVHLRVTVNNEFSAKYYEILLELFRRPGMMTVLSTEGFLVQGNLVLFQHKEVLHVEEHDVLTSKSLKYLLENRDALYEFDDTILQKVWSNMGDALNHHDVDVLLAFIVDYAYILKHKDTVVGLANVH